MPRVVLPTVILATTLTVAACGSDAGTPERAAAPEPSAGHTHSMRVTPTPDPAPDPEPTSTASAPGDRHGRRHKVGTLAPRTRGDVDSHLLDAARLPLVGGRAWAVAGSTPAGAVGACQKTALDAIGAVQAVSRTFTADQGGTAVEVVGRFADAKSAWRAHQVLVAWRDDCESRVPHAAVGPLRPVDVRAGTADSYRSSLRSRSSGLGILRTGSYLTLVEVTTGADTYPTSWDPARVAVRRIARTF